MDNLVFLDTETTGNELLKDRLFQVCYLFDGKIHMEFFKPPLPISIKAQSVTHITNQMVEDKKEFTSSEMKKDLEKLLKSNILVAHNAMFDILMLEKEGIAASNFICTLKVVRFLDEENKIPEYNLQYLRYYLELDVKADSHDAKSDVLVLKALFNKLFAQMLKMYESEEKVIEKMIEVSSTPFLIKFINFGKYRGRKVEEVLVLDKRYLEWLLSEKLKNGEDDDWLYTLKYHLKVE